MEIHYQVESTDKTAPEPVLIWEKDVPNSSTAYRLVVQYKPNNTPSEVILEKATEWAVMGESIWVKQSLDQIPSVLLNDIIIRLSGREDILNPVPVKNRR